MDLVFRRKQDLQISVNPRSDLRKPELRSICHSQSTMEPYTVQFSQNTYFHLTVLLVQKLIPLLSPGDFSYKTPLLWAFWIEPMLLYTEQRYSLSKMAYLRTQGAVPLSVTLACTSRVRSPLQSRSLHTADF